MIHCETGAGVHNPLQAVADVCARHGRGLIVDAMSSFAALEIDARKVRFDALIAASGKCLEGVPGMGFVFLRKDILDGCAGNSQSLAMDLYDQYVYMEKTGQWRFTPPTHVLVALDEAIAQFLERQCDSMHRLLHLHRVDGADAADAEGLNLRELTRVQDETVGLGRLVKATEIVARIGRRMKGHDDGRLNGRVEICLLYTSPSPRDRQKSRMPSSA